MPPTPESKREEIEIERQEGREEEETGKGGGIKRLLTKYYLKTNIIHTIIVTRFKMAQLKFIMKSMSTVKRTDFGRFFIVKI